MFDLLKNAHESHKGIFMLPLGRATFTRVITKHDEKKKCFENFARRPQRARRTFCWPRSEVLQHEASSCGRFAKRKDNSSRNRIKTWTGVIRYDLVRMVRIK